MIFKLGKRFVNAVIDYTIIEGGKLIFRYMTDGKEAQQEHSISAAAARQLETVSTAEFEWSGGEKQTVKRRVGNARRAVVLRRKRG